jgi:sulfur-oxidizing protein SoxX
MKVLLLSLCLCSAAVHATESASAAKPALEGMPATKSAATANVERGRKLLLNRQDTGCILCHVVPGFKDGGNMGPSLVDVGQRLSPDLLRQRIADPRVLNPQTFMPAYFSTKGLQNVAKPLKGKTVLTEQALEDIISYLLNPPKD